MKYPTRYSVSEYNVMQKLKKIFEDFGGVDFGNPAHGEVEMNYSSLNQNGSDEWVKKVLNKTLKKLIRELPIGHLLHSIRFKPSSGGGEITLVFKDRATYDGKRRMTEQTRELLTQLGYGPNLRADYR